MPWPALPGYGTYSGADSVGHWPTGLSALRPRCHLGAADDLACLLLHKGRRAQPCAASTHGWGICQHCPEPCAPAKWQQAWQQQGRGGGKGSPGQGLPFPGPCLWVRLGQRAPSHPTVWRERQMFQAQVQDRSRPWQGSATPPSAQPVAMSSWTCLPSGGCCQPVGACVGCPGKVLRKGISLAPASKSVSEPVWWL